MFDSLVVKSIITIVMVSSLISCSASSSDGETDRLKEGVREFSSTSEMSNAFTDSGLSCTQRRSIAKEDREIGQESALEVGECDIEGETVQLVVWKDNGQRDNFVGMGKTLGCAMGEAFGITSFDYVEGDKWLVTNTSETLANQIADNFGGKAVHIEC